MRDVDILVFWSVNTILIYLFLMETHCHSSKATTFWNRLGYGMCAVSEASAHSGGIGILKNRGCDYDITNIDVYFQAITISIKYAGLKWYCSATYASPHLVNREFLWHYICELRANVILP